MKNWVLVLLKCNEFNTSACQEISICLALIVWSIFEENDKKNSPKWELSLFPFGQIP